MNERERCFYCGATREHSEAPVGDVCIVCYQEPKVRDSLFLPVLISLTLTIAVGMGCLFYLAGELIEWVVRCAC
jgi:hypothetical protein